MNVKQHIKIKDKKIRDVLRKGGRQGAKKDFFELLKRAAKRK